MADATAQCRDGSYSYSQHHSGTCSHHGGVAVWLDAPAQATRRAPVRGSTRVVHALFSLTPGAFNPAVSQATIGSTICDPGYTRTIRPPSSYTSELKLAQMRRYRETGPSSLYEEDHLIPLELGGAPRNPQNLWPEPRSESRVSDPLETKLKRGVCRGALTLAKARTTIHTYKATHG